MNKNNENEKTLLGFIVGAAAGVAVGMLLAPFAGEESRKKITDKAKTLNGQLGETINKVTEKVTEAGKSVLNKKAKAKPDVTPAATTAPTATTAPDTGEKKKSKKAKKNKDNNGTI